MGLKYILLYLKLFSKLGIRKIDNLICNIDLYNLICNIDDLICKIDKSGINSTLAPYKISRSSG